MENKELQVSALQEGTVIDHIPADKLFEVISMLKLDRFPNLITFGTNLLSNKLGRKAIIKVSKHFFKEEDYNKIALVAPNAKLNEIRNYQVVSKHSVQIPKEIHSFIKCFNPACITNAQPVESKFKVMSNKELALKCHYCEKITSQKEIRFK